MIKSKDEYYSISAQSKECFVHDHKVTKNCNLIVMRRIGSVIDQ